MPTIWDENYLQDLLDDAEDEAVNFQDYIWDREAISVTAGTSTYALSDYIRKITRVTWKGEALLPLTEEETRVIFWNSVVLSAATAQEYPSGKPTHYALNPYDFKQIRFLPTPNETIASTTSNLFSTAIDTKVIISYWRSPDVETAGSEHKLPSYISRRLKKSYALYKAFLKEGKGQNLKAALYHKKKWENGLEMFRLINNQVYISQKPTLQPDTILQRGRGRPAAPQLPSNFPGRKI